MSLPTPFAYPSSPHTRLHGPQGYVNYQQYKPWLRDEFSFCCVYCLERENWHPNLDSSFSVDHFEAKVLVPEKLTDYDNLVYACLRCNSFKQDTTVFLNPAEVAFSDHFLIESDGHILGLTTEGQDLIDLLDLDGELAVRLREEILIVLSLKHKLPNDRDVDRLFQLKFGYPPDEFLPDLTSLRPPKGNIRIDGVKNSYREKRKSGTLPKIF